MATRLVKSTITFKQPFVLAGLQDEQPAGDYLVETEEERLEGLSFEAYRRVKVLVHLRRCVGRPNTTESVWIEPSDLDAAQDRDSGS